ncbi:DUF4123 domain-containing protein [Luteimonas salinilitoris]|uniref:DUF4123 domain-containing protein n=1 Tax=Luteimonas salinilitoris TaxID=3237697 RepID=A0ABV4HM09_9GAMM
MVGLSHREFLAQDYALINPMQVAPDQYRDLDTVRLLPKGLDRHARMMPLLLRLKSLAEHVRIDLLHRAEQWARDYDMPLFSALMSSDVELARLKAHLLRNMLLKRLGVGRIWLRFHDPRVYRHLCWLLDGEQMARLMGPVSAWMWYDPLVGAWHTHERAAAVELGPLQLSQAQWKAMDQVEALNRCMRDLADEDSGPLGKGILRQLMAGLLEAQRKGLDEIGDRVLYATQFVRQGADSTSLRQHG